MREIKFKLWDTRLKYFHELEDVYEILIGNLSHIFTNRQNSGNFWDREDFEKRFKITQYTGLKDKNGKEIYEGDLVLVPYEEVVPVLDDGSGPIENNNLILTVEYDLGSFRFIEKEAVNLTIDQIIDEYCSLEEIEVIGNIYENPEIFV